MEIFNCVKKNSGIKNVLTPWKNLGLKHVYERNVKAAINFV